MDVEKYNLTTPQYSIWLTEKFFSNMPINNIGGTQFFEKNTDISLLKKAINVTIKNNDALRTTIILDSEKPLQYFKEYKYVSIPVYDFTDKSMEEFREYEKKFMQKCFDIYENRLFRFSICVLSNGEIALVSSLHHLIVDAWSIGLISNEIACNYTLLSKGLDPINNPNQYPDFIKKEENYLNSDLYNKNKVFWNEYLKDSAPVSIKNSTPSYYKADRVIYNFTKKESSIINKFCSENNISAYVLFLTAFNIYLYRTTSLSDFTIQTPIFNRSGKEKSIVGMFINMISVRMKNSENDSVKKLIENISKDSFSQFKNSKYPYVDLLKDLRKNNNVQNYNIVFSFQKASFRSDSKDIIPFRLEWFFPGYMQDEFVINVSDLNNSGVYQISYDFLIELFSKTEVEFIHNRIKTVLFDIIKSINKKVSKTAILPKTEVALLKSFNETKYKYDSSKTLIDLFEDAVSNYPDNIAIVYKDHSYSYRQLNTMANNIANIISSKGLKNSKIALLCKKSAWMVACLLGIMKSGNCYVPIDAEYPEERIKYIIQNSNAQLLITSGKIRDLYDLKNAIVLEDIDWSTSINFKNIAKPEKLAYMIYTSGTTGKPKGVKIKHENILNTLIWRKEYYKFNPGISVLQIPSFAFDSSVEDIFTPLISGAKLVISSSKKIDVNMICEEIVKNKVNHFLVVPSLYKVLLHEKLGYLKKLKFITIAGENFPISLVKEHFAKLPHVRLINEYGPTENSVCSTYYELTKDDEIIYIGKPIYNNKCYVLDSNQNLLPIGVKGELYVSGPGVSLGYYNKPRITNQRFLDNPFDKKYKMYKTGDIVSRNFDGNLEFIGRDDGQVKLHGFRIELKEIEKNILKNKDVSDTVVMIREITANTKKLVAYITSYKNDFDINSLYEDLRKSLPPYMIPTMVVLDKFPLTPNGKIDKSNLPLPNVQKKSQNYPENKMERLILDICRYVLEIDDLSVTDDLFTVGNADSLSILTINSKLFTKGIKFNTQDFYKCSTVRNLVKLLNENLEKNSVSGNYIIKPKFTKYPNSISSEDLKFNFKNVLLTGSTGFLGIHILDYLLKNTDCLVYCIIREKYGISPEKRLKNLTEFYFNKNYYKTYRNRIVIINGDLLKDFFSLSQEEYTDLQKNIDCIIHTAANTKHYGSYTSFEKVNVNAVKNLISFAKPTDIIFNHMSTTTVSGNYLTSSEISYNYTENDFYIGQNYKDNVYVCSKFEAEKIIIEEEYKGLKANIFRLGNLMARYSDGVFQKNKFENAYYTRLLALAKIGALPKNLKSQEMEFSPIDDVASAIIKILSIPNLENNIFHIFNNKLISIHSLLKVLDDYGYKCNFIDYNDFTRELHLQKNEKILKYIISDLNNSKKFDYSSDIAIDQTLTNKFLDLVGFKWSDIDEDYLKRFFDSVNLTKDIEL